MVQKGQRMPGIGKGVIAALLIACLVMTFGCASVKSIFGYHEPECQIEELENAEEQLDSMAQRGIIRPDQAEARKTDLQQEWNGYMRGGVSCEGFRNKIKYHLSN
jgi:hypothetical protein